MEKQQYNILVLDDEKFILFTVSACLKSTQFQTETATTAAAALELFRKKKFDAVISDIMMDSVDGFMFRDMIRKYDKQIPIIFLTSLVDDIDNTLMAQIMKDHYSYYLGKNFDRTALIEKLDQAVQAYNAQNAILLLEKKFEKDLELATQVQSAMLPPWVQFGKNYEFSYLYKPLYKISGDIFEWIPLDEDSCLCIFGDISGHGIHSALAMTAVQSILKQMITIDMTKAFQPHLVAKQINDFFCQKLNRCTYMTGLIAIWNFKENILRFHNAGHPDLICFDSVTGDEIPLNPERKGGLPLGLIDNAVYREKDNVEIHFPEEALFMAYSDGLLDLVSSSRDESGMDMNLFMQLASTLAKQDHRHEDDTISIPFRCREALEQIGYDLQQDDFSMFVLRKTVPDEREETFLYQIPPDNNSVDLVSWKASEFVLKTFGSEELAGKVEILLSEFLVNIVKHGLGTNRNVNDFLVIKIRGDEKQILVTVWDRGKIWKDNGLTVDKELDKMLLELSKNKAQSGRGIPLILKITPQISRRHHSGLNETIFTIKCDAETIQKTAGDEK